MAARWPPSFRARRSISPVLAEHRSSHDHVQQVMRLYSASHRSAAGLRPRIPLARKPRLGARARASHKQCCKQCSRVGRVPWNVYHCPVARNVSARRLRATVTDRGVSQRFWLKSARARRFFRSQRPRYFGIVSWATAKARAPCITEFEKRWDRAGIASAIFAPKGVGQGIPLEQAIIVGQSGFSDASAEEQFLRRLPYRW